jgi:hypothetical protein
MATKKIDGVTVSFNSEHQDDDGYSRCNTCGEKTILVFPCGEWIADDEPYKNGEQMELEESEFDVGEVTGHFCQTCNILVSLSYNFPRR